MRPLRLLVSLASFVVATTLLLILIPRRPTRADTPPQQNCGSRLSALFSFHTPLFPPSAIISLTDDNSTFFLARPAAFGPLLPSKGLSGQLWIGSGFSDDSLGRGGVHAGAEGELGCSDVPGWDATTGKVTIGAVGGKLKHQKTVTHELPAEQGPIAEQARLVKRDELVEDGPPQGSVGDDGTDDHLHAPSPGTDSSNAGKAVSKQKHADIESLQETAEIAGKIVLLSRGGCGFLEKAKWAQRRGGIALIVGDDVVGGPLVTMYAKGDTSNVTIPALFTSHTTAHLLSSLIPPDGFLNGAPAQMNSEVTPKEPQTGKGKGQSIKDEKSTSESGSKSKSSKESTFREHSDEKEPQRRWFASLFGRLSGSTDASSVSRRPPSSGRLEWVRVDEFHDNEPKDESKGRIEKTKGPITTTTEKPKDDFVIGVQDWRDPDVLQTGNAHETSTDKSQVAPKASEKSEKSLKGGSITPGSGEYESPGASRNRAGSSKGMKNPHKDKSDDDSRGWFSHLFSSKHDGDMRQSGTLRKSSANAKRPQRAHLSNGSPNAQSSEQATSRPEHHEGLWVTLTPTNISSSPFFDTLLVLVVSPLITLTVVYALLLLRSRIRRRRWRAPKSVVERLPVRTYHTIPSEAASTSALATPAVETTPLLEHSTSNDVRDARRVFSRSRANSRASARRLRSFTTSQVDTGPPSSSTRPSRPGVLSRASNNGNDSNATTSHDDEEKRDTGLAEWRRRYGGRQRECVVCLEEYVDGVSRVMSLPCGHEFHVECM